MQVHSGYASNYRQTGDSGVMTLAKRSAAAIKKLALGSNTAIVVHGNSGVSIGFAALTVESFPLVLVRKDNDNSHGSPIEGPDCKVESYYILDDIVDSGATVRRIVDKITKLAQSKGEPVPVCRGVILYKQYARIDTLYTEHGEVPCFNAYEMVGF